MNKSPAFLERSAALAVELGQPRRMQNSWFFMADTDREEAEHRVDFMADRLYCTCAGWRARHYCKHVSYVRELMENSVTERHLVVQDHPPGADDLPDVWRSPQDLARRLADLREERGLVHEFMKDVMVASRPGEADGDYGIIPGTDKPTLFKAGAEKLCELYGYGINIADIQETADEDTGHYRVVVRVALIHKGSGVRVAEGIGECSTRESKYWKRWAFASEVPEGIDKKRLKRRERTSKKGVKYTQYLVENDDLHSLWNTILKMGKKRALVDATLSATRSSGIFTQSAEHLDEWIEAEFEDITEPACAHEPGKVRILNASEFDRLPKNTDLGWICECGQMFTAATVPPASDPTRAKADETGTGLRMGKRSGLTRPAEPSATPPEPEPEPDAVADAIATYWARFEAAPADVKRDVINELVRAHRWTNVEGMIDPVVAVRANNPTAEQQAALLAYLESCPL